MAHRWWRGRPLVQVLVLYLALAALVFVAGSYLPWLRAVLWDGGGLGSATFPGLTDPGVLGQVGGTQESSTRVLGFSLAAMAMSFFLMLPVVLVFAGTRAKRGYSQAMVQTLLILPVVVAGVVILVKNSLALAFSLGGIVGAVSFRNRLQDPKDAVYVFLAIAVGLACGVQVYAVAFALSLFFNAVILVLWYSDFGRVPAALSGAHGWRRVELAQDLAEGAPGTEGTEFVSALDDQILRSMTPEQLSALAERAMRRGHKMATKVYDGADRFEGVVRIVVASGDAEEVRSLVEPVLGREAKEWRYADTQEEGPDRIALRYRVTLRKKAVPPLVLEAVRRAAIPHADRVSFE